MIIEKRFGSRGLSDTIFFLTDLKAVICHMRQKAAYTDILRIYR